MAGRKEVFEPCRSWEQSSEKGGSLGSRLASGRFAPSQEGSFGLFMKNGSGVVSGEHTNTSLFMNLSREFIWDKSENMIWINCMKLNSLSIDITFEGSRQTSWQQRDESRSRKTWCIPGPNGPFTGRKTETSRGEKREKANKKNESNEGKGLKWGEECHNKSVDFLHAPGLVQDVCFSLLWRSIFAP